LPSEIAWSPGARRSATVVIGSGLLLYRWMDLAALPPSKRRAAVAAQLKAWSPFARSDFRVAWLKDGAGLFAWDAERLQSRMRDAGIEPAKVRAALPEPWLQAAPDGDAVRLIAGMEGVGGEVWKSGVLRAMRWWPRPPSDADWLNFLRGVGSAVGQSSALDANRQPQSGPLQRVGWAPLLTIDELRSGATQWESFAAFAVSLGLVGWTAYLAQQQLELKGQRDQAETALADLTVRSGPVIETRDGALREATIARNVAGLLDSPDALAVVEHVLNRLPQSSGIVLRQFELTGRQVRVNLEVPASTERASIVSALEGGNWLTDVREAPEAGVGALVLTMALNSSRPPDQPVTPRVAPSAQTNRSEVAAPAAGSKSTAPPPVQGAVR
jgi:hypothetical protein